MKEIRNIQITNDSKFPLEIGVIINTEGKLEISIGMEEEQQAAPVSNGKLTGIQLRTIAAKDQLEALLEDELFNEIKDLAESSLEKLVDVLQELDWELDSPTLKAISAMALFCYTEIVERGLKQPGIQE